MTDRTQDQAAGRRHRADDGRNERIAHFVLPVERRRRRVILAVTLTALIVLLPCPAVAELSPAIQADLYLVQAEDYRQQKDYAAAQEAMGKILELQKEHDLTLPPVFHFKYAQVLDFAESYDEAIAQLHQYLELAGALGKHYREALTLLHEVTKAAAAKQASEEEEAAAFARAQSAGTAAAYGIYLRKYTNGRHVAEARSLQAVAEDDEAFARAKSTGTVPAYGTYLSTYPSGRHAAEARRLQAVVRREEIEKSPAGTRFQCKGCPEMVVVPAGTYMMGSPESEAERDSDEGPRHRVTIARPFAVGVYEVTFDEWDACVKGGGCNGYRPDDKDWGRGNRPVINVSWEDAQEYVKWLSSKTGAEYRLLSEAEWEYVARAGTTTPFHYGSKISTRQANYNGDRDWLDDHYGNDENGQNRGKTVPVGRFRANSFGLHDVHGNVYEWVEDCQNNSYAEAPSDGSAWGRGNCGRRMVRGGSWSTQYPRNLRSALRFGAVFGNRYNNLGFRVARTLDS